MVYRRLGRTVFQVSGPTNERQRACPKEIAQEEFSLIIAFCQRTREERTDYHSPFCTDI